MPFVYVDEGNTWNSGDEMGIPSIDQFEYLPPPDFGGSPEPVRYEELDPAQLTAAADHKGEAKNRSLLSRILQIFQGSPISQEEVSWSQKALSIVCPILRQLGGRRVRCAYDGGNDEGFAWVVALETETESILIEDLVNRLEAVGLADRLVAAGLLSPPREDQMEKKQLSDFLLYGLADSWAIKLLGEGFGTGEFSMYGAFTVDLENRTIHDDRNATPPENGNIEIQR